MSDILTCKACEKNIPAYLNKELSDEETIQMIDHITKCPSCKDELNVQYMVSVGLNNLDEIIDLNVDAELESRKRETLRSIHLKDFTERFYLGVLFLGVSTFFLAALLIIL